MAKGSRLGVSRNGGQNLIQHVVQTSKILEATAFLNREVKARLLQERDQNTSE